MISCHLRHTWHAHCMPFMRHHTIHVMTFHSLQHVFFMNACSLWYTYTNSSRELAKKCWFYASKYVRYMSCCVWCKSVLLCHAYWDILSKEMVACNDTLLFWCHTVHDTHAVSLVPCYVIMMSRHVLWPHICLHTCIHSGVSHVK